MSWFRRKQEARPSGPHEVEAAPAAAQTAAPPTGSSDPQPSTAQPSTAQPGTAQPSAAQSKAAQPSPSRPSTPTAPAPEREQRVEDQRINVSVDEHLNRVLAGVRELRAHPQPLMETLGLSAAEEVRAQMALPSFDNSAMDGYAVRAAEVAGATFGTPVTLPVVGENTAGRTGLLAMAPGTAVKVMTGAPVPVGADAVVPYEWTDRGLAKVEISRAPTEGQHIRRVGEDVAVGDLVLEAGAVIGPRQIGLLAGVGRSSLVARPKPRVVIISTGSELREPGSELGRDAINDANSYLLAAAVRAAGAIAYRVGIVPDEPRAFSEALNDQLVRADLVITSGGVSEGDRDVVKAVLKDSGTVWFGQVAMQPGKPQGFGTIGDDHIPIFTLPGNPVSTYVSFQLFVLPALRKMMGRRLHAHPTTTATLGQPLTSTPGKRQFVRAVHSFEKGRGVVTPVGGHGSHLLGDLAVANALIVLGERASSAAVGDQVDVLLLDEDY